MTPSYTTTSRFWLVFILTVCVLCTIGCGSGDSEPEQECTIRPTPQFVGPVIPCSQAV